MWFLGPQQPCKANKGRVGVSNAYLDNFIRTLCEKWGGGRRYKGVFPADQTPRHLSDYNYFIANTDNSNEPGEHFVVIFKRKKKNYLFDPLAYPIEFYPDLQESFGGEESPILVNPNKPVQDLSSQFCGFFCALFCLAELEKVDKKISLRKFRKKMLLSNDEICIQNLLKIIREINK